MENDPNVAWLARTYRNTTLLKAFTSGFLLGVVVTFAGLLLLAGNAKAGAILATPTMESHPIDVDLPWYSQQHFVCKYSPVLSDKGYEIWLCGRAR